MKAKCTICGREDDSEWMTPVNTGRRTLYECYKCHALGQKEAKAIKPGFLAQYKKKIRDRKG